MLGDDVELDLAGAALDGVAARTQPLARLREIVGLEAGAFPTECVRAARCRPPAPSAPASARSPTILRIDALGAPRASFARARLHARNREREATLPHGSARDREPHRVVGQWPRRPQPAPCARAPRATSRRRQCRRSWLHRSSSAHNRAAPWRRSNRRSPRRSRSRPARARRRRTSRRTATRR